MLRLVQWTGERGIHFIADESFVDFADEENASLLDEELLDENPHLTVVKSISKSYGIPGLRLGIAASADTARIQELKRASPSWNINSLGEFYMQIEENTGKITPTPGKSKGGAKPVFSPALRC